MVAADACTDDTPDIAVHLGAAVIELPGRNVGAARAAGVAHALHLLGPHGAWIWIVTTDADSLVPPTGWRTTCTTPVRAGTASWAPSV
ncbi:hypothetical protein [Streptomyces inhibens]|uniref:hypothetical protein n=1 Tax=Streptomyces inhibens TaxID=2293571 RepID=UPI001FD242DB|nr:hypothetical protein [Streptomyces inhibens]